MNEIVKYKNEMNTLSFKGFSSKDYDILMVLCSKIKEQGVNKITLDFQMLKKLSKITIETIDGFIKSLERMNIRLSKVNCRIETKSKITYFVLFPTFEIDKEKQLLTISVNPDFSYLLNNLTNNFTRFELEDFINLSSKYSKNLYRLLKQWRITGETPLYILAEFKELLDIPKSYENKDITKKIIKPIIKELEPYFKNLKCRIKKAHKKGTPIIGYQFSFEKEIVIKQKEDTTQEKILNTKKTKNNFNNFPQNEYDFDQLEKELLSN